LPLHGFGVALRNQRIILRATQKRCNPDKILDELIEIARGVTRSDFFQRKRDAVARGQFEERWRLDRALQMNVQLRFRDGVQNVF
jgi:hypothetical protein